MSLIIDNFAGGGGASTGIVLSLCDWTGNMVRPWADAGYRCVIVDVQHPAGETVEGNITRIGSDILDWLPPRANYAIAFAFPPCTDLAVSGARHFRDKGLSALAGSLALVERCRRILEWTDAPWMLENPVGTLSTYWRKPDYIFDPCDYGLFLDPPGDAYTKRTCLWTGGGFVMPETARVEPVRVCSQGPWVQKLGGKSQKTKRLRSATPMGFATAVFAANRAAPGMEACGHAPDAESASSSCLNGINPGGDEVKINSDYPLSQPIPAPQETILMPRPTKNLTRRHGATSFHAHIRTTQRTDDQLLDRWPYHTLQQLADLLWHSTIGEIRLTVRQIAALANRRGLYKAIGPPGYALHRD